MVYVTGDTHADFGRFSAKNFPDQKYMTRDDIVIILGDFGGIWYDNQEERDKLEWLSQKPFTICFVDGNHENYDRYYHSDEFETIDFHGGKAQKIRENIYHLMRGYVFDFEGSKFFCMGGARSHDISDGILDPADYDNDLQFSSVYNRMWREGKMFRVNHETWWKEELPSQAEMDFGQKTLEDCGYCVDYVISHCLPQSVASIAGFYESDSLTEYFDQLLDNGLRFKRWYCGHYHFDTPLMMKYHVKYYDIERIL